MKKFVIPIVIFIFLSIIFLLHYFVVGTAVYGDGILYWSYTRSIVKDRNLDLRNEKNHNFSPNKNNTLEKENYSGRSVESWFPIGVSLSWIPVFATVDVIANIIHSYRPSFPNNGYSDIYQITIGLLNIVFITIGVTLLFYLLKSFFSPFISWLSALTWLFASNLLYYGSIDVINSHPFNFLLSVLFIFIWYKTREKRTIVQWEILGIILGILSITRTQDLLFIFFLIYDLFINRKTWKKITAPLILSLFITLLIYFGQMLIWINMYGGLVITPYSRAGFSLLFPHLFEVIWSEKNGLLRWTPIFLFGFIGLWIIKNKTVWYFSLMFCFIQILLIGSWVGWNVGGSYGMRLLLSSSFAYCLGLGAFFELIQKMINTKWLVIFALLICLLNISNIIYFLLFIQ
jgi:hypothetical protein